MKVLKKVLIFLFVFLSIYTYSYATEERWYKTKDAKHQYIYHARLSEYNSEELIEDPYILKAYSAGFYMAIGVVRIDSMDVKPYGTLSVKVFEKSNTGVEIKYDGCVIPVTNDSELYYVGFKSPGNTAESFGKNLIPAVTKSKIYYEWSKQELFPDEAVDDEPTETDLKGGDAIIGELGKSGTYRDDEIEDLGEKIVNLIQVVGVIIAIVVLILLGIKFIFGSVEEKSRIKQSMIPYLIGAILVFGTTTIVKIIYEIATMK